MKRFAYGVLFALILSLGMVSRPAEADECTGNFTLSDCFSGSWLSGVTDYNSYGYWGLWAYTESSYQALMTTPSANNYFGYGNDPEDFWYYEWGSRNRSEPADLSGVTARWNGQGVGIYSFAGSWNENEFKANVQLEYSASATGPGSLDIGWNKDTVTGLNSTTFTADQKEEVANNFTFWGLSAPTDGSGRWKYDMSIHGGTPKSVEARFYGDNHELATGGIVTYRPVGDIGFSQSGAASFTSARQKD